MRIIAGLAKGMTLVTPRGGDVRPTSDRVREAIFSSLGERVIEATVLDLFAGTGALGLEAASRGAARVTFVESARDAIRCLEENLRVAPTICTITRGEAFAKLKQLAANGESFSLIFADPPYGATANELLRDANLRRLLIPDGRLILESGKRDALEITAPWRLFREATYGDTRVSVLA